MPKLDLTLCCSCTFFSRYPNNNLRPWGDPTQATAVTTDFYHDHVYDVAKIIADDVIVYKYNITASSAAAANAASAASSTPAVTTRLVIGSKRRLVASQQQQQHHHQHHHHQQQQQRYGMLTSVILAIQGTDRNMTHHPTYYR